MILIQRAELIIINKLNILKKMMKVFSILAVSISSASAQTLVFADQPIFGEINNL
jgi:hypothetical protein